MAMTDAIEAYKAMQVMRLVGWGMQESMRRRVSMYRATGNVRDLEEAITQPQNRRDKMTQWIADNGLPLLDEYLSTIGVVTRAQLNTYVQGMCDYTQGLYDHQQAETMTLDEIATDIETNVPNPADQFQKLVFPFSAAYLASGDLYGR